MIMKKILFILVAALIVGCKTCEPIVQTVEKERIVEVRTHDTTIVTEADSASVIALLECDSAYNVVLRELTIEQGKRIVQSVKTERVAGDINVGSKMLLDFDCKEDSLLNIIAACIKCGSEIELVCDGPDENEALAEAVSMIESGLGE
jgi:phosphotransferase system HPr-like phosphotransfer protein